MTDNHPIGLFDSGVGGLSILLEIQNNLPQVASTLLQYKVLGQKAQI